MFIPITLNKLINTCALVWKKNPHDIKILSVWSSFQLIFYTKFTCQTHSAVCLKTTIMAENTNGFSPKAPRTCRQVATVAFFSPTISYEIRDVTHPLNEMNSLK